MSYQLISKNEYGMQTGSRKDVYFSLLSFISPFLYANEVIRWELAITYIHKHNPSALKSNMKDNENLVSKRLHAMGSETKCKKKIWNSPHYTLQWQKLLD